MTITLATLKNQSQFSYEDVIEFIDYTAEKSLFDKYVASYLMGYNFNKEGVLVELLNKPDVQPELKALVLFPDIISQLLEFAPNKLETSNKKEDARFFAVTEPIYKEQMSLSREWKDVSINYFMARNDVIYKELVQNFAQFIAIFEEIRKFAVAKAKSEPLIRDFYNEIYKTYDPKTDWFEFIISDVLVLKNAVRDQEVNADIDLVEMKQLFWDTHKKKRADFLLYLKK